MTNRSRRIVGTIFVLTASIVCARLGLWQLSRLSERKATNAVNLERSALPALVLNDGDPSELVPARSAVAHGEFDLTRQIVRVGRPSGGVPGVVIVTPLLMNDTVAVLVERGWAPSPDARSVDLSLLDEPEGVTVQGVLVAGSPWPASASTEWPIYLPAIHPDSVQPRFPYQLVPLMLRRTDEPRNGGETVFRAVPTPAVTNGPHLGYAIQWFSFGLIALVGGWLLLYRKDPATKDMHH